MGGHCVLDNECLFNVVLVFDLYGRGGQEKEGEGEGWGEERLGELGEGRDGDVRGYKDEYLNSKNERIIA